MPASLRSVRASATVLATGLALLFPLSLAQAERIGKVSQPLVAGTEVSAQEQQDNALVGISTGCSGSMLNNEWVISAAHCFQDDNRMQNVVASDVTVRAVWSKPKSRKAKELYILGNDIAILRLETPIRELAFDYNMPVYTGNLAPGRGIRVYGRGIYQLATGSGDAAVESQSDGQYRAADFQLSGVDDNVMSFGPSPGGAIPAGGDSGGPAFINAGGRSFLAGISSECQYRNIDDRPDDKDDPWKWVSAIPSCSYVRIAAVWPDILARIGSPGCRKYAWRAVGTLEYAKSVNCDPATISGPRWSPDFDAHLEFCKGAQPAVANFEDKERFRISQECRIAAGMPQGTVALQVAQNGVAFLLSGAGYEVNTRVIIRATDAAGIQRNITSNRSDAGGNLVASIDAADVCTVAGPITFTAEDQDKAPSAPVTANCPAPAAAGDGGGESPIAQSADAFNGTWSMRMSDGVGYVLTLAVDGDKVNGTFRSPGRPELDGTVAGSLPRSKKGRFEYTFSQPGTGLSSFGVMTVHEDDTLKGTLDEASDGKSYTWSGRRGEAGAAEEPAPPAAGEAADGEGAGQPAPADDAGAVDPGQPEPAQTADFAGTWEMHNSRGTPFILTLRVRGARVSGKFVTPGRPKNSGVLEGRITADGVMDYVFEQPRLRFRGQGRMTVSGDRIEGQFSVENSAEDYSWSGVRTAGEAQ
ncbi:MAG: trypsin-like serine protease [Hyphomicrobiaceae bacterium]